MSQHLFTVPTNNGVYLSSAIKTIIKNKGYNFLNFDKDFTKMILSKGVIEDLYNLPLTIKISDEGDYQPINWIVSPTIRYVFTVEKGMATSKEETEHFLTSLKLFRNHFRDKDRKSIRIEGSVDADGYIIWGFNNIEVTLNKTKELLFDFCSIYNDLNILMNNEENIILGKSYLDKNHISMKIIVKFNENKNVESITYLEDKEKYLKEINNAFNFLFFGIGELQRLFPSIKIAMGLIDGKDNSISMLEDKTVSEVNNL